MEKPQKIEEILIDLLKLGPIPRINLIQRAQQKTKLTIQGIYKSLRLLKNKEIVTAEKNIISLSFVWLNDRLNYFQRATNVYKKRILMHQFLNLESGEHITLKFKTLRELDIFWTHAFLLIETRIETNAHMYSIIPHDWFLYLRPITSRVWNHNIQKSNRYQGTVMTYATESDKKIIKKYSSKKIEFVFNENPLKLDELSYINILDSWIFEAKLDETISSLILQTLDEKENRKILPTLLDSPGNYILKIYNAPQKAEAIRRKIEKYFTFTLKNKH